MAPRGGEAKKASATEPTVAARPMDANWLAGKSTEDVVDLLHSTVARLKALLRLCESSPPVEDAGSISPTIPRRESGVQIQT